MSKCHGIGCILIAAALCAAAGDQETTKENTTKPAPIGIEGMPEYGDASSWALAEKLQLDFAMHWASWKGDVPYSYSWTATPSPEDFKKHLEKLKKRGYAIAVADTTVHMTHNHLPAHIEGKRFNDPELLDAWEGFLTDYLNQYGDYIDFFSIGNEIDLYFGGHMDEWADYPAFFKRGAEVIRKLKPHIKIGVVLKPNDESLTTFWKPLEPLCDYLAVTYYTPNSALGGPPTAETLKPDHQGYFTKAFDTAFRYADQKPIVIVEVGSATAPEVSSTPELQAQFIRLLFEWLPGHEDRIAAMLWLTAKDWPYEGVKQALTGHLPQDLLEDHAFMRYLTSLGLMYEDGAPKPGLEVFKEEVLRYKSAQNPDPES